MAATLRCRHCGSRLMTATPGTARRGLRAWWQRLRPTSEAPRPTALVLSGGGARASFQLGALRYLYDEVGIEPQIIAGTSAGAILGAMLAQAGDRRGQREIGRAHVRTPVTWPTRIPAPASNKTY